MQRRTCLGLEILQQELRAVAVRRRGKSVGLVGSQTLPLPETVLQPSFKKLNITQPKHFVATARELLSPLTKQDNRIAVALPDNCGRLFLIDTETPFKNRTEGTEIIRWHLKDQLPDKAARRMALDFQILEEKESGQKKILVAAIAQDVLSQYEDLLEQAGFAAAVIDFHTLALHNAYRTKIDLGSDFVLIGVDGSQLSILVFVNKILNFCRTRHIERKPKQIFQEINRSLATYRNEHSAFDRMAVHLHSDWEDRDALFAVVDPVFDQDVQWLVSPVSKLKTSQQTLTGANTESMATAFGVAERMTQRLA